jgi:hypothetical protein
MNDPLDGWKTRIVTYGISLLFILKFGKFVVLEAWEVVGPLFAP